MGTTTVIESFGTGRRILLEARCARRPACCQADRALRPRVSRGQVCYLLGAVIGRLAAFVRRPSRGSAHDATTEKLRWGILSTGQIASLFARALRESRTGIASAVGSRTRTSAERFGAEFGIVRRHPTYEALLADSTVDAVYVAPPHPLHAEWTIKAAEAGKHILCEKPLAVNRKQAQAMIDAARTHHVFLMEALMYRCSPQMGRLVEAVRSGVIGEVRVIQAAFGFRAAWHPEGRLLNRALGGGGILDVGCYPVSFARLIAGAALGRPFADPLTVHGAGDVGATGVDESAVAVLKFERAMVAEIATAVRVNLDNVARIYGTEGWIHVSAPWGLTSAGTYRFTIHRDGSPTREISGPLERGGYAYQADAVAEAVARGASEAAPPAMTWDDTLGNLETLDRWRRAIGLCHPED